MALLRLPLSFILLVIVLNPKILYFFIILYHNNQSSVPDSFLSSTNLFFKAISLFMKTLFKLKILHFLSFELSTPKF